MSVRFSVLMPVYNRQDYVREAIDSVLSQNYTNFELIAVDDGSTDDSLQILKSYGDRIRVVEQKNQGPEIARNTAAAIALGEYLVWLDSDDFLLPFAFEVYDKMIRAFDSPPLVLGSDAFYLNGLFYKDGQLLEKKDLSFCPIQVVKFKDFLSKTAPVTTPKIVLKKSVFDEVGGLRKSSPKTFHNDDLHLLINVGTYGPCVVVRKPFTVAYRLHGENSIKNVKAIADGMLELARSERRGEFPGGVKRRWDRYVVIGGRASTWALRYCWRGGQKKLAFQLLAGTSPMIFAAVWTKLMRHFKKPAPMVVLPDDHVATQPG